VLRRLFLAIVLFSLVISLGCVFPEEQVQQDDVQENETEDQPDEEPEEIANPAAVNCEDLRYDYEIRTTESGGAVGYCMLNGSECEEWALYRGECCLTPNDCDPRGCNGTMECIDTECVCVPEPEPEPEPVYETWEGDTQHVIDERFDACDSLFYSDHPRGEFSINYYTWAQGHLSNPPDQIPIGIGGLERAVLFDDDSISSLIAIGFRTYSPSNTFEECGLAIFDAHSTVLDTYETFSIDYNPGTPQPSRSMSGCEITGKTNYISGEETIAVYEFVCG